MQLHHLTPTKKRKSRKRISRGGKRGTYSGRGLKGQKSRAGRKIRKAERDLILRLPKRRGFKNPPQKPKFLTLNLKDLSSKLKPLRIQDKFPFVVDKNFLKQVKLIPMDYRGEVKILGDSGINIPLNIKGLKISKSAKIKIEKAGGKVS